MQNCPTIQHKRTLYCLCVPSGSPAWIRTTNLDLTEFHLLPNGLDYLIIPRCGSRVYSLYTFTPPQRGFSSGLPFDYSQGFPELARFSSRHYCRELPILTGSRSTVELQGIINVRELFYHPSKLKSTPLFVAAYQKH